MDLIEEILSSMGSNYNITVVNTPAFYDVATNLRSTLKKCIYNDNSIGLTSKGSVSNFESLSKSVKTNNTNDIINKYFSLCEGDCPLILVNPLDINGVKVLDSVYRFDYQVSNASKLAKHRRLHVIIIADMSDPLCFNSYSKYANIITQKNLDEKSISDILGDKYTRMKNNQKNICKNVDQVTLRSIHRTNSKHKGRSYYDNFKLDPKDKSEYVSLIPSKDIEVYGMDNLKQWCSSRSKLISGDHPIPLKGISVLGIPGTGKSLSSRLISESLNVPLYRFDIHNILDQYLGNSETNMKKALDYIDSIKPCVVLIDEVDKMFSRSDTEHQASKRVMGILLQYMEAQSGVFWVFTGNDIAGIPPELLRKGRLDEFFYADKPDISNLISFAYGLKTKYEGYKIVISDSVMKIIESKIKAGNFLYSDIETFMSDIYLFMLNNKQGLEDYINNYSIISSFTRYESEYKAILKWSEQNAKAID